MHTTRLSSLSLHRMRGEGRGEGFVLNLGPFLHLATPRRIANTPPMSRRNHNEFSRRLRREQTPEEKALWKALRSRRFAGFKFRRQHEVAPYFLDFYCPLTKLAVELDGFGHGLPGQREHDAERDAFLAAKGIEMLRFWNGVWNKNREGCLMEIWAVLSLRVPAEELAKLDTASTRYVPPKESEIIRSRREPDGTPLTPALSPPPRKGEGARQRRT